MIRECMHCRRTSTMPGTEGQEGVSHGMCARCLFFFEMMQEAADRKISIGTLFMEEPDRQEQVINALARELRDKIKWDGEVLVAGSEDEQVFFKSLERRAQRLVAREGEKGGTDRR